jgi:hypothetical protein
VEDQDRLLVVVVGGRERSVAKDRAPLAGEGAGTPAGGGPRTFAGEGSGTIAKARKQTTREKGSVVVAGRAGRRQPAPGIKPA